LLTSSRSTYKFLSSRKLCAKLGEIDGQNRHLPPIVVPAYPQAQRPPDDLVPEAYADDAHPALLEDFFDEVD
jgi:hypothetical protein